MQATSWLTPKVHGLIPKTLPPAIGEGLSMTANEVAFLSTKELCKRWHMKPQTLANWRHAGTGPPFVRISPNRVLYPVEGILNYEKLDQKWLTQDNSPDQ